MSNYQEGCRLTLEEIAAILSLAGQKTLVGFLPDQVSSLTQQGMISACADLMRDQMMTCIDGKFRLCADLVGVMKNLHQARTVLAVIPSSDLYSQVIYYVGQTVTAMEMTTPNRYVLTPMEREDLPGDLAERMDVQLWESSGTDEMPVCDVDAGTDQQTLLKDARFLIECLDPATGRRTNWMRLVFKDGVYALQWTSGSEIRGEILTEETWRQILQLISGGENRL